MASKKTNCSFIGGQALMEGVMMRGKTAMAMTVRTPSGDAVTETKRLGKRRWYNKIPIIRGVVAFISSLVSGVTTLTRSAEVAFPEEETPSKGWMGFAVFLGIVLAVGLFIVLPNILGTFVFERLLKIKNVLILCLIEGAIRIIIFILYLFIVSRMKDIRRTFMYHGAEHKTINCYEKGLELTVENVQQCSTRHNRCGTTFLFFVMIVSILVFSLITWGLHLLGWNSALVRLGVRLVFLPLVAGLSYELLRFLAILPDNWFVNIFRAPGLALQRLTTYQPTNDMVEIAIKSFTAVYEMDLNPDIPEVDFYKYSLFQTRDEIRLALAEFLPEREAQAEADWILCHVLDVKRSDLHNVGTLDYAQYKKVSEILKLRIARVPLDYILGVSEFYGLKIKVNKNVLIPRMETEVLVSCALEVIGDKPASVLDLCTGSGCVAKAIASNSLAKVTASDVSEGALEIARENVGDNVTLIKSDMFENINEKFDVIVSNPPYIRTTDKSQLAPEVTAQPEIALFAGESGLDYYVEIAKNAKAHLNEGGVVMVEIGFDMADDVCQIFVRSGYEVTLTNDLDGNNRVVTARAKKRSLYNEL